MNYRLFKACIPIILLLCGCNPTAERPVIVTVTDHEVIDTSKIWLYYRGYSIDPFKRLNQHNNQESRYTRSFGPWELVYIENCRNKTEALKRDKVLKKYSKQQIKELILSPKNEL